MTRAGGVLTAAALAVVAAAPLLVPAAAQAQGAVNGHVTYAREANQLRLGANGLEKCRAFRKVRQHTDELQAADHGSLTPGDTRRLMRELSQAKAMPPHALTAPKCGVPL